MLKPITEIIVAQDFLKAKYGEEGYKKIMAGFKQKLNKIREKESRLSELDVCLFMTKDSNLPAVFRIIACAYMGDEIS